MHSHSNHCYFYNLFLFYLGGLGQLGIECAKLMRSKYGNESVILSDIIKPNQTLIQGGPYIFADILDFKVSELFVRTSTLCSNVKTHFASANGWESLKYVSYIPLAHSYLHTIKHICRNLAWRLPHSKPFSGS